ncbi:Uncharacterized protein Rs2_29854 [Raphanus sativus]|uniref:Uncharacterized protein LOC108811796 n=1 Tax=Raphanus sativus TaxID=3726 RepID=A0A6J0JUJ0_RAPSA|nr:uncharacterized protein LOC108811796 [Raphanus sativus]KAJ4890106.1 Uncharacterized protein Rs2_29854 [Raphanus sativus]
MAHQDNLDHPHRCNDSDEQDPTTVTIEFLRARLLAERAVSKSARAKLDGLADKVAELEEQLKIVSLQRKKAEQATADVLAILAENGFNDDVSDGYDSSSDQESYSQTSSGKSLSWKGRRREAAAASSDKAKEPRDRRQRGFDSAYIWRPRHRQGRSCRQIKRSETRTVSEDHHKGNGNAVVDLHDGTEASEEASRTVVDVDAMKRDESLQRVLEKRDSMDVNLERALAKRAQVIGSFEDMEETQKQWEKEFTDNKSSALDLCDVGNHSDVTDESNGEKAQEGSTVVVVPSLLDTKCVDHRESFEALSHGSPDDSVTSSSDKCCKSCGSKSIEGDKGKHIAESPKTESSHSQSSKGISSSTIQPNSRGSSFCSNATTIQKLDYLLVPVAKEKSTDTCETVLTALKQAKLSLQEKVIRKPESSYPSSPGSYMNTYALPIEAASGSESSLPASNLGSSMVEFPVGCAGLFRVPTVFSPDASTMNSFLACPSSSQRALISHTPDTSPPLSMDERPLTTPYIGGPKLYAGFRADTQESRRCKATTPSVSGIVISGFGSSHQLSSSSSFNLDRRGSTYTPMTLTRSSVLPSREMYSTPYYTRAVGLPPSGGSGDGLFRRV